MSSTPALAFATPAGAPRWKRWLVYCALARIAIFCIVAALFLAAMMWLLNRWAPELRQLGGTLAPWRFAIQVVGTTAAYLFLVRVVERRRPVELLASSPLQGVGAFAAGALGGAGLIALTVGLLWLAGSYRVLGVNASFPWWAPFLTLGLAAAVAEEIVFRGVLFRVVEEGAGTWWALGGSALFFGGMHIGNPGATLWSSAAIAIEAGLMLGLAYHVTRSLPLCIGLHLGWNFTQGTVFGIPVSGADQKGWLVSERVGPDWLSGGAFGAEASVLAVAVCSVLTAALLLHALRHKTIVPPRLRRAPIMQSRPSAESSC